MSKSKTVMTSEAASRIQSAEAKTNNGQVAQGGFASRAQSAASKSNNKQK